MTPWNGAGTETEQDVRDFGQKKSNVERSKVANLVPQQYCPHVLLTSIPHQMMPPPEAMQSNERKGFSSWTLTR